MRRHRIPELLVCAALLLTLASPRSIAGDAELVQKADLLDSPAPKAKSLATLAAATPLTVLGRQGGWYRVRAPSGEEGWVKLLAVRLASRGGAAGADAPAGSGGAALEGAQSGGAAGAAAGAIGSMVSGSAADSTAVRGGAEGKLSGERLVKPGDADASLQDVEGFEPSDADMDEFERGLEEEQP
ncbi:MAG: SH3 domain-containing protein [Gammaproteobacteria bacterium]